MYLGQDPTRTTYEIPPWCPKATPWTVHAVPASAPVAAEVTTPNGRPANGAKVEQAAEARSEMAGVLALLAGVGFLASQS